MKKASKSRHNAALAAAVPPATDANWPVTIGVAAQRAGVSARMLRHYEGLGLLPGIGRTDSGYRLYTAADVHTLRFIRRARDVGFAIPEITLLLDLWRNQRRASAQVKAIAQRHMDDLDQRIAALQTMQRSLQPLLACCQGNDRPDCPILDDLAAADMAVSTPSRQAKR